jgi:hypothetical protein
LIISFSWFLDRCGKCSNTFLGHLTELLSFFIFILFSGFSYGFVVSYLFLVDHFLSNWPLSLSIIFLLLFSLWVC